MKEVKKVLGRLPAHAAGAFENESSVQRGLKNLVRLLAEQVALSELNMMKQWQIATEWFGLGEQDARLSYNFITQEFYIFEMQEDDATE